VIPHPNEVFDFPLVLLQSNLNSLRWNSKPATFKWLQNARLDWFGSSTPPPKDPAEAQAFFEGMRAQGMGLCTKLRDLLLAMREEDSTRAKAQLEGFGIEL
jgi:hypothetical protein